MPQPFPVPPPPDPIEENGAPPGIGNDGQLIVEGLEHILGNLQPHVGPTAASESRVEDVRADRRAGEDRDLQLTRMEPELLYQLRPLVLMFCAILTGYERAILTMLHHILSERCGKIRNAAIYNGAWHSLGHRAFQSFLS
ncbi:hypothetical protein VE03_00890 [Pseudogymnoascus sp. 23342-1-I1]|nr:hypothetical protein VE03_00890 [Pseudogymnoascus sp. 23342-1-I1]